MVDESLKGQMEAYVNYNGILLGVGQTAITDMTYYSGALIAFGIVPYGY